MSVTTRALPHHRHAAGFSGIAMRKALGAYLLVTALIMLLLLATAWAIDLARNFDDVQAKAAERGVGLYRILVPYLAYRGTDIVTRLLPIACFIGLFLAEILRRQSLESVILAAAGHSPLQGLAAVVAFGLIAGGALATLETWARPAAVFAQVELGVGQYADRFRRGSTRGRHWFVTERDAMRAGVVSEDTPELRNIELYRGFTSDGLEEIVVARRGVPAGEKRWRLEDAIICNGASGSSCVPAGKPVEVDFDLIPPQLTYLGIPAFYLPNQALSQLAEMRQAPNIADIDFALWRRWTAILLPGAFALLGASIAQIVWSGRVQSTWRITAACFAGYLVINSIKVFASLGELGAMPAAAAALTPIGIALAGTAVIQYLRS